MNPAHAYRKAKDLSLNISGEEQKHIPCHCVGQQEGILGLSNYPKISGGYENSAYF
jgi:hypothetical protein